MVSELGVILLKNEIGQENNNNESMNSYLVQCHTTGRSIE